MMSFWDYSSLIEVLYGYSHCWGGLVMLYRVDNWWKWSEGLSLSAPDVVSNARRKLEGYLQRLRKGRTSANSPVCKNVFQAGSM